MNRLRRIRCAVDDHFWDWALWLGSKQLAGRIDLVTAELGKLHTHLLAPLGIAVVPSSLGQAVADYRVIRDNWEQALRWWRQRSSMPWAAT